MPSTVIIVAAAAGGAIAARSHKKTCVTVDGKMCEPNQAKICTTLDGKTCEEPPTFLSSMICGGGILLVCFLIGYGLHKWIERGW